jgi:hypothetical protein
MAFHFFWSLKYTPRAPWRARLRPRPERAIAEKLDRWIRLETDWIRRRYRL